VLPYLHPQGERLGRIGNYLELERRLKEIKGANAPALGESIEPPRQRANILRHQAGVDHDTPPSRASHEHPNHQPPSPRRLETC
jgi:hypothetical protein